MASNVLHGTDDEKIKELCTKTHKEQAIWYLNAFWEEGAEADKELFWLWVDKFNQVDLVNGASGNALDELNAHRFLEHFKETQTVMEMRTNLREVGAIPKTGRPKDFPITHFLIARFKKDWHKLVNASQGDNKEAIEEAQRKLDAALDAMQAADDRAKEAAAALREALSRESAAKASEAAAKQQEAEAKDQEAKAHASAEAAKSREADAHASAEASKAREVDLKAAQAELEAALAEVKKQEDAYNAKTAELKAKSEGAGVSAMRAKNELAQHLGEDPLPLRRAKITAEAAVKKSERATKAAAEARTKAEADAQEASKARTQADADAAAASEARAQAEASARQAEADARAAEAARTAAEEAKGVADAAAEEARCKVAEAEAFLQEEKSKPGQAFGALWWMERALYERKKYMPVAKGGVRE